MRLVAVVFNPWQAHRWRVGIFFVAIVIHYYLGLFLTLEGLEILPRFSVSSTTPVNGVTELFGTLGSGVAMLSAAALAHAALIINGRAPWYWRLGLMLWQQFIVSVTVIDILTISIQGRYADGYAPIHGPHWFILADQGDGSLIIGILHTLAVLHFLTWIIVKGRTLGRAEP